MVKWFKFEAITLEKTSDLAFEAISLEVDLRKIDFAHLVIALALLD